MDYIFVCESRQKGYLTGAETVHCRKNNDDNIVCNSLEIEETQKVQEMSFLFENQRVCEDCAERVSLQIV